MAQCMESGIAPATNCGMKVGRSPRDRRNGRDNVRPFHNCSNPTGGAASGSFRLTGRTGVSSVPFALNAVFGQLGRGGVFVFSLQRRTAQ